jgi:phage terminase small subunit|tara:strand:- start:547 stop:939 length:393 start_codon:yes stop_codon:yes gene_type:complete
MKELTTKQESFAQAIVKGSNQADAYRLAYSAEKMKDETIWSNASRLIIDRRVQARIKKLRQPSVDKVSLTLDKHLNDLLILREKATNDEKWSSAIQAETVRGKAAGLHVEKIDMKQDLDIVIELVKFGDD